MSHHLQRQRFLRNDCKNQRLDRFIPNRSAIDFGYAHYMVTEGKDKDIFWDEVYCEAANIPNRIFSFRNKPSSSNPNPNNSPQSKPVKKQRPKIPHNCDRSVLIPGMLNDFSYNLIDWGTSNLLALGHEEDVYLYIPSCRSHSQLLSVDEEDGPVTSISWAPDGTRLAVGFNNSLVQLWDTSTMKQLITLRAGHRAGVGSLAWNDDRILTTGGMDGKIVNNDVRLRSHIVNTYTGHQKEVCGLKWSRDGQQLASGGNDNVVHIWDNRSVLSSNSPNTRCWLHKFQEHTAPVKALAWCPFRSNLLASGGGQGNQCIKLWDTCTGARLKSVDTGSEVCALLWNKFECELLSSHGFTRNNFTLWKYPSMAKMAEINKGHTSRVLYIAPSPDGCTMASASADGTLRLWNLFGTPAAPAPPPKRNYEPFANFNCIH